MTTTNSNAIDLVATETLRIDKRRSKEYGRTLKLTYLLPEFGNSYAISDLLKRKAPEGQEIRGVMTWEKRDSELETFVRIQVRFSAVKPSLIIEDTAALEAVEWIPGALFLFMIEERKGRENLAKRECLLRYSRHIVNQISKKVREQALANVSFEEKLAALEAEYLAEATAIADAKVEGWLGEFQKSLETQPASLAEVSKVVKEHLPRFIKAAAPNALFGAQEIRDTDL
jgi:hypothetical protein